MLTEVNEICDDLQYLTLSEQRCGSCCELRFLQVHRLRQIIGCLLGARATNLLDHMSAACQAQSQCSNRTELCRTGKQTHCASTYVSSHWAFEFLGYCLCLVMNCHSHIYRRALVSCCDLDKELKIKQKWYIFFTKVLVSFEGRRWDREEAVDHHCASVTQRGGQSRAE